MLNRLRFSSLRTTICRFATRNIVFKAKESISLSEDDLGTFLMKGIAKHRNHICTIDGDTGEQKTFHEFETDVLKLTHVFKGLGMKKGDVVLIHSTNHPQYFIASIAAMLSGAIVSPSSPSFTKDEIKNQILDSNASFAVYNPVTKAAAEPAFFETNLDKKKIFTFGNGGGGTTEFPSLTSVINNVPSNIKLSLPKLDYNVNDCAMLPYSSGTTGKPKGVMLSHLNITSNVQQYQKADFNACKPGAVNLMLLPYFHIYAKLLKFSNLVAGMTSLTIPSFVPEKYLELIQKHKMERLFVVPPIILFLINHPLVSKYDISSVKFILSGAAPLNADLHELFAKKHPNIKLKQGYGMTELSPMSMLIPDDKIMPGSGGLLVPSQELKIVNSETGKECDYNETGEIWCKGPNVMLGYLNRPDATKETLTEDKWLKTGDVGHIQESGHVFITDRIKDLIKYKGHQVCPTELEGVVLRHPSVADVAVVGVNDHEGQEIPKAFIILKPKQTVSEKEVMDFVNALVDPIKKIREVQFLEVIPKTASGKILRRQLRDQHNNQK